MLPRCSTFQHHLVLPIPSLVQLRRTYLKQQVGTSTHAVIAYATLTFDDANSAIAFASKARWKQLHNKLSLNLLL